MYPAMLDVEGRSCLVVGGGGVALRKIEGLVSDGALVTTIAPEPIEAIVELAKDKRIRLLERRYTSPEAAGYWLVFAATDDRETNRRVYEDAEEAGKWVNVADDPELCSFHLPARIRRGAFQVSVASAGAAPFVVRRTRQMLERLLGDEWAEWTEAAARFRKLVRERGLSIEEQEAAYDRFFDETVDQRHFRARVPAVEEETRLLTGQSGNGGKRTYSRPSMTRGKASGCVECPDGLVSLVGAGPGDPGLMTRRGYQRLMAADVVVYDRLAMSALPCDLPDDIELRSVGKKAGHHPVAQDEITALLVRLAREGKRVVRLKGGDPYVFGRGGEEAEVLAEAGIAFEVVPSVTAGVAVPAYAGIPVTYRKQVVRVTLVTAHESTKKCGPQVRWDLLAADPHTTIVGYMGVTSLPLVIDRLLAAGMDPETPAAIVERGTTSRQRTVRSSVADLPHKAKRGGIRPPALFVIGPSVAHAEKLDWFTSRPLLGQRLVVPAPAGDLGLTLSLAGVEIVEVGLPVTNAARIVMGASALTGCVFRSPDDVDALDDERDTRGWSGAMIAWCLGGDAARRARKLGWTGVEEIPASVESKEILARILERIGS